MRFHKKLGISDQHNAFCCLSTDVEGSRISTLKLIRGYTIYNALLLWGLSFVFLDIYKCPKTVLYPKIICCKVSQKLLNTDIKTPNSLKSKSDNSRPNIQSFKSLKWRIMKITPQQNYCDVLFNHRRIYFNFTVVPCEVWKTTTENSLKKLSGK